jgi:hypothetical protein
MQLRKLTIRQEFKQILNLIDLRGLDNEITLSTCSTLKNSFETLFNSYAEQDFAVYADCDVIFPESRLKSLLITCMNKNISNQLIEILESAIEEIKSTRLNLRSKLHASLSKEELNLLLTTEDISNLSSIAKDYFIINKIIND